MSGILFRNRFCRSDEGLGDDLPANGAEVISEMKSMGTRRAELAVREKQGQSVRGGVK